MPRPPKANKAPKRQVNVEVNELRFEVLMLMARETESISTNGTNKGEPSVGALVRRISEGHVVLYYRGRPIKIPPRLLFGL